MLPQTDIEQNSKTLHFQHEEKPFDYAEDFGLLSRNDIKYQPDGRRNEFRDKKKRFLHGQLPSLTEIDLKLIKPIKNFKKYKYHKDC